MNVALTSTALAAYQERHWIVEDKLTLQRVITCKQYLTAEDECSEVVLVELFT